MGDGRSDISIKYIEVGNFKSIEEPKRVELIRSLYKGAKDIQVHTELNTQTKNMETHIKYLCDIYKNRYVVYAFVGEYEVIILNNNKVKLIKK